MKSAASSSIDEHQSESILESIERLREVLRTRQARLDVELGESLRATGWVRDSIVWPVKHLQTMDEHKWAKVSFVEIGCWKSPSGRAFLTRLDQYNLEQAVGAAQDASLGKTSVEDLIAEDDNDNP